MSREVGYKDSLTVQVTEETVKRFAEMSGDYNPIHMDEGYAATTRFKRRIAHGMIIGALISRGLNEKIGAGGIYLAQTLKFVNPVFIDDIITIDFEITHFRKERGIAIISTLAKKQTGEIVAKGDATIMMPTVASARVS